MIPTLLCVLAAAPAQDADLTARFALAEVPGVRFVLASGEPLPAAPLCAGETACRFPKPRYDIYWRSAPAAVTALRLPPELAAGARVLLRTSAGAPLLLARDRTVFVAAQLPTSVRNWPYFNYLLYAAATEAAGGRPVPFAEWPHAPLPNRLARRLFAAGGLCAWLLLGWLYRLGRKKGREHPRAAAELFAAIRASAHLGRGDAQTWNRSGFARPLAGLLTLLSVMCLGAGGFLALQWLLGAKVQPFPEADGLWRTPQDILWIAWILFDCGNQVSFVKHFAEHRNRSPRHALADLQFYVWWQLFARLLQGTLLAAMAVGVLPFSRFALYAPFVGLYALVFLPGLNALGKVVCQALHRSDYQSLLDLAEMRVLLFILPIPLVLLGRRWGATHPLYGEAFGAALGLGLGQMATNLCALGAGIWVLRRLGLPLRPLALAQFDWATARRQLGYGAKVMLCSQPVMLAYAIDALVLMGAQDFTAWQGVRTLLCNRLQLLFAFSTMFFATGLPAITEAFSAGKRTLVQYYVARYFQFAVLFVGAVFSLMVAIGPCFIRGLGPQWARAAPYLWLAMLEGALGPFAWMSDFLQLGTGNPWKTVLSTGSEQLLRILLCLALVPRYGFVGILVGTTGGLAFKALFAWTINHRTIVPLRLAPWSTAIAPLLAAAVNYVVWSTLAHLLVPTHLAQIIGLFCVASGLSFFVVFFVCALAGGFDALALQELAQACMLMTWVRGLGHALVRAAHAGARLTPVRSAPAPWMEQAHREAKDLDAEAEAAYAEPIAAAG